MDKLVTITIASYNNAQYIERCIKSVVRQSYSNLDILIVDDGSKDDSLAIIEKYKEDKRVRILTKENGGLSSVRQLGLERAEGDYISFIDADDYLAPTYVERMLGKIEEDQSDICLCGTRFEDMEGNYLPKESRRIASRDSVVPLHFSLDDIADPNEQLSTNYYLSDSWDKMYRISFIRESGVVFNMPKGLNGSDMVFNRRLFLFCPVYSSISSEEYVHVIYKSSAVHRKNKDLLRTAMIVTEQMLIDVKRKGVEEKLGKRITMFYYKGLLNAFKDVYAEYPGLFSCRQPFKDLCRRHKGFEEESGIQTLKFKEIKSKEMATFLFSLRYISGLLPLYFKLHSIIFS